MSRTRIKICGLTRPQDVRAAVEHGADAVGFVFYPPSPRAVGIEQAAELVALLPPFVTSVGLFVNASGEEVNAVLDRVPLQLLQFHGDETDAQCARHGRPWIKAARMRPGVDLVEFSSLHPRASGVLVDAFVDGYGGGGKTFDWSLIPAGFERPLVLSGGLDADNVVEAVRRVRPWAVDVSSGVESAKGIKDAAKIAAFIAGVRNADG
ncbi:MAG: phosphoribosylanthranilate isomerase [Thauera propionica]|jgi:phosphoribosylanthranilate isomerase|uniref:N-(5'-phosphoribosyl)anthranilate isomerase n=1 Tax=Thauera propionica TaxID=2019431 RepID=A0A235EYW6_9RHOO|nr:MULTISPECIES: phosphoribosylanthranilate isomerase [Thauera]MDD3674197.1 phosphoribosylanthranilate isomerase [Thauera propionica]MDI3491321.1 phosphoribosylanthranilate isomerase [Thauera sp.]MDY0047466.1 phosphoribosylanthranilate isomerase [Thauera propionica]OYD53767.1 phosphoribosylanthranilate isomerase [Thauera propionica]